VESAPSVQISAQTEIVLHDNRRKVINMVLSARTQWLTKTFPLRNKRIYSYGYLNINENMVKASKVVRISQYYYTVNKYPGPVASPRWFFILWSVITVMDARKYFPIHKTIVWPPKLQYFSFWTYLFLK